MTLDERVRGVLGAAGIAHALIGAAALAAAGVARSTFDLDYLTTDARVLAPSLWAPLHASGIDIDARRGDDDDPLAGIVRVSAAGERPVDVIVGRFAWQRRAVDRARSLTHGVRVVLPRDLVLLKLFAGGTQDLWDIDQLLDATDDVSLAADVDADLGDLPAATRDVWHDLLSRRRRRRDGEVRE
jgi:hypothetical protein